MWSQLFQDAGVLFEEAPIQLREFGEAPAHCFDTFERAGVGLVVALGKQAGDPNSDSSNEIRLNPTEPPFEVRTARSQASGMV